MKNLFLFIYSVLFCVTCTARNPFCYSGVYECVSKKEDTLSTGVPSSVHDTHKEWKVSTKKTLSDNKNVAILENEEGGVCTIIFSDDERIVDDKAQPENNSLE